MRQPFLATLTTDVYYYDLEGTRHVCKAEARVLVQSLAGQESVDARGRVRQETADSLVAEHDGDLFEIDPSQFRIDS